MLRNLFLFCLLVAFPSFAFAAEADTKTANTPAVVMFFVFVMGTLFLTYWASLRTKSTSDFYTAGGSISGLQNGLAIAGDYMSAASFLGITALVYTSGLDGIMYAVGFLVGWPIILFLMAEQLRNLGKYTFTDIASYRLRNKPIRILSAFSALAIVSLYLIAQMVGSGQLIKLLFGLDYNYSVIIVGVMMIVYVAFGGMLATTWVQMIKAVLLLGAVTFMTIMILFHFNFSLEEIYNQAVSVHEKGIAIMSPGPLLSDPVSAISLGLALMFGTAGLPHILMRFFTVPDAKSARQSVFYATTFIGYFYLVIGVIGFAAIVLVLQDPQYFDAAGDLLGGGNMVAVHLSHALGGDLFLGFVAAVAFATILAVVAGLTLSGASAISHDLYTEVIKKGKSEEKATLRVSRLSAIAIGVLAILLGISFENQNVAFMVGLAFSIAASTNFPVLILSIYWPGLTTRGTFWGGLAGLVSALSLVILSPTVWVNVFGFENAIFPYTNPALFSMSIAFGTIWWLSKTDKSPEGDLDRSGFLHQQVRSQTGIGIEVQKPLH